MSKELEVRSYTCQLRAEQQGEDAVISGRPVVYNSRTDLGWFDEIIERGALDYTDLTDVRLLVNHQMDGIPLARSRRNNGSSTMKLTADNEGLLMDYARLDVKNNARAAELFSAIERGDITGMSFRFSIDGEEWEDLESEHPTRRITRIGSIVEVSACTWPAYDATEIFARSKEALESARSALESARQQAATSPDGELEAEKAKLLFY